MCHDQRPSWTFQFAVVLLLASIFRSPEPFRPSSVCASLSLPLMAHTQHLSSWLLWLKLRLWGWVFCTRTNLSTRFLWVLLYSAIHVHSLFTSISVFAWMHTCWMDSWMDAWIDYSNESGSSVKDRNTDVHKPLTHVKFLLRVSSCDPLSPLLSPQAACLWGGYAESESPSGVLELWMDLVEIVTSGPGWLTLRRQTLDFISPYLAFSLLVAVYFYFSLNISWSVSQSWVRDGFHRKVNCVFHQPFLSGLAMSVHSREESAVGV